jgi:ACS family tartrate transporter-like MFS transporter
LEQPGDGRVPALQSALGKARRRIIPFLFLLYVVAYLDRVNVGFGALDMNRDLGFSAAVYGFGSGIFFLSYTLLEVPSNLLLARVGARVWIARITLTWGLVASMMAFVNGTAMFYGLRFVLGAAEAGFFPGIIFYLTRWFPARERARTISIFMTATAMAGVIGAPLSSALLRLEGFRGLHGWQWLFIIEGIPAVLLAPVVLRYLTERPEDAAWLTADERSALAREIALEQAHAPGTHVRFADAVWSARLWALSAVYFCLILGFYGVSFWLPQIVQAAGALSSATVVMLSAIPYFVAAMGMVIIGAHSDRTGERRWHVAGSALVGATGFALTALAPAAVATSLATLSIAALGIWGALGPFWTMPPAFLRGTAAAGGIAVVNSVGNLGGFVGPFFVGYVREVTGSFSGGLLGLAASLVLAASIALAVGRRSG